MRPELDMQVVADGAVDTASVPMWLSWKIFHQSVLFYLGTSAADTQSALASKFDLSTAELELLLTEGQQFLGAVQKIDSDARAYVETKYADPRGAPPNLPRPPYRQGTSVPPHRPIRLEPGARSLREMLERSGYLDQVEAAKQATVARHVAGLQMGINAISLAKIQSWVSTEVTRGIKVVDRGVKVPGIDRSSSDSGVLRRR